MTSKALMGAKLWDRLTAEPDKLIDNICAHVASGGTVIDLSELWHINYGHITNWIDSDQERSRRYTKALNARAEWAKELVLREVRRLAISDLRKLYNDDGSLKDPKDWPDDIAAAVSSLDTDELFEGSGGDRTKIGLTKKLKLWSKSQALDFLGKNLRLLTERHEHTVTTKLEDLVAASMKEPEVKGEG